MINNQNLKNALTNIQTLTFPFLCLNRKHYISKKKKETLFTQTRAKLPTLCNFWTCPITRRPMGERVLYWTPYFTDFRTFRAHVKTRKLNSLNTIL